MEKNRKNRASLMVKLVEKVTNDIKRNISVDLEGKKQKAHNKYF